MRPRKECGWTRRARRVAWRHTRSTTTCKRMHDVETTDAHACVGRRIPNARLLRARVGWTSASHTCDAMSRLQARGFVRCRSMHSSTSHRHAYVWCGHASLPWQTCGVDGRCTQCCPSDVVSRACGNKSTVGEDRKRNARKHQVGIVRSSGSPYETGGNDLHRTFPTTLRSDPPPPQIQPMSVWIEDPPDPEDAPSLSLCLTLSTLSLGGREGFRTRC